MLERPSDYFQECTPKLRVKEYWGLLLMQQTLQTGLEIHTLMLSVSTKLFSTNLRLLILRPPYEIPYQARSKQF